MKIRWISLSLLVASSFALVACNTVQGTAEGAKQDMQAVGHAMDGSSSTHHKHATRHHKKSMHHKASKPAASKDAADTNATDTNATDTNAAPASTDTNTAPAQ